MIHSSYEYDLRSSDVDLLLTAVVRGVESGWWQCKVGLGLRVCGGAQHGQGRIYITDDSSDR
jgi:hypothetical protein